MRAPHHAGRSGRASSPPDDASRAAGATGSLPRLDALPSPAADGGARVLAPRTALRRYGLISFLTWFPPGLTMASMILLMTSRGLDLAQVGMVMSVQAIVVVALELPTGGLADVLGRRVLLAVSALFSVAGLALLAVATSVWLFMVASVLKGVARALSSGPAQAWYVDMLHAARGAEADLKPGLARGEAMGSLSLCLATLTGGFMPLVLPGGLVTPMIAAAVAAAVLFVVVLVAMPEPPRPRPTIGSVMRDVPVTIGAGLRLGLRDRALSRLLLVSFAIGAGLYSIEVLTPGRLASLTGGAESASSVYALVASAGFAASGFGSWSAPWVARLLKGSVPAAVAGTGVGAAALGTLAATTVLTGVWGVAAAGASYVVMFAAMGVAGLLRVEMMHRRVGSSQRATLMSVDSLQLQFGGVVFSLGLGLLASRAGTAAAWWSAAAVVLVSALLYLRLPAAGTPPSRTSFGGRGTIVASKAEGSAGMSDQGAGPAMGEATPDVRAAQAQARAADGKAAERGRRATPASEEQRDAWKSGAMPKVEQVRPGLWSIPVPIPINPLRYVLVYALELPGGVAIIDAGWNTEEAYTALVDGLAVAGYAITDVRAVLVTHIHPDHYGLAGRVREASGAWIGLHPADAALLHDRYDESAIDALVARERALLSRSGVPPLTLDELSGASKMIRHYVTMAAPDRLIEDGATLDLPGWDLRAVWTPGHSPGHLCFVSPSRRVLFSGDHVLARITPIVAVHPQSAPDPLSDYLDALAAVRDFEVDEVLPAHEYRFLELADRVDYVMAHHAKRLAEIESVVAGADGAHCWDITTRLTWSRPWDTIPAYMRRAATNETLAHLVYLEARGWLRRVAGEPDLWYPDI